MTDSAILEADGLTRNFGAFTAVDHINLRVEPGTIHSVIGPNGAGKTTLFRLLTGILRPNSGSLKFDNQDIAGRPPDAIARLGLAQTFQVTTIFPRLTVIESVRAALVSRHRRARDMVSWFHMRLTTEAMDVLDRVGLAHAAGAESQTLSHGDQRALEVALALAMRPRLLLLDEPTAGMSPFETKTMVALIQGLAQETGLSVVLSEHDMDTVFGISDHVTVMHQGRVLADGPAPQVRANSEVMEIYLGTPE